MHEVLIHVRDFESHTPAAAFGVRLTARLGASATAVHARPKPFLFPPEFELMTDSAATARKTVRSAVEAKHDFVAWATSLGVSRCEWLVARGKPVNALAQAAMRHDLMVLDHGDADWGAPWDLPGLIIGVDIPCIVVPHHGAQFEPFGRIAIGWNGSPEATRAVYAALPFLAGKQVLLLWGEERDKDRRVRWEPRFDILEYLRRKGASVEQRAVNAGYDDVATVLLEEADAFGADVLVMGAYGRTRFGEWMLGGATRHVLAWAKIPLLLRR